MITGIITVFDDRIVVHKRDHRLHDEASTTYPAATEANLYDAARLLASWLGLREGEPVARSSEQTQADDAVDTSPLGIVHWLERNDVDIRFENGTYKVIGPLANWTGEGKTVAKAIRAAILAHHNFHLHQAKSKKPKIDYNTYAVIGAAEDGSFQLWAYGTAATCRTTYHRCKNAELPCAFVQLTEVEAETAK